MHSYNLDILYEPPFDMPDYKTLGRVLLNFPQSHHANEASLPPNFVLKDEEDVVASLSVVPAPLTADDRALLISCSTIKE
jgi:hypothetical protein